MCGDRKHGLELEEIADLVWVQVFAGTLIDRDRDWRAAQARADFARDRALAIRKSQRAAQAGTLKEG